MHTTRRNLLKSAAVLALPWRFARAANPPSPVILKLGNYMAEAAGRALPEEVIEKTKHHILDTLAAMISGGIASRQGGARDGEGSCRRKNRNRSGLESFMRAD